MENIESKGLELFSELNFELICAPFNFEDKNNIEKIVGEDIKYDDKFFELEECAREDSDSLEKGVWIRDEKQQDWDKVFKIANMLLCTKSKHLKLLFYIIKSVLMRNQYDNFFESLCVINRFIKVFKGKFYPANALAVNNLVDWFFKSVNKKLKIFANKDVNENLKNLACDKMLFLNYFNDINDLNNIFIAESIYSYSFDNFYKFASFVYGVLSKNHKKLVDDMAKKTTNCEKKEMMNIDLKENSNHLVDEKSIRVEKQFSDSKVNFAQNNDNELVVTIRSVDDAYAAIVEIQNFLEKNDTKSISYLCLELIDSLKKYTIKDLIKEQNNEKSPLYYVAKLINN